MSAPRPGWSPRRARSRQTGVALLAVLTVLTLWGLYFLVGQLSTAQLRLAAAQEDARVLAEAREALIARAAGDDNRPGSLPCPATGVDGIASLLVGNNCPAYIGRFPWYTLRVGELRDSSGELLWYVLAPTLRDDDSAQPINRLTPVALSLDGTPNVAAIVVAPRFALDGQGGRPGNAPADYLDGSNNDGDSAYVSGPPAAAFNDQVLAVSREAVFDAVKPRVLGEIAGAGAPAQSGLRRYHADNGSFPWADGGGDGIQDAGVTSGNLPYNDLSLAPWLAANGWLVQVAYERVAASVARLRIDGTTREVLP